MGLIDDIDQAFDAMFVTRGNVKAKTRNATRRKTESRSSSLVREDEGAHALLRGLSAEKYKPLAALGALLDRCTRAYVLAALHGAIAHVRAIEPRSESRADLDDLQWVVTTKRGGIRKRLSAAKARKFSEELLAIGGSPDRASLTALEHYLRACEVLTDINLEEVSQLFNAGLWHPDHITGAPVHEIVHATSLPENKATALQKLLN